MAPSERKKTRKPKLECSKIFKERTTQVLTLKRKKLITEIRREWLRDHCDDMREARRSLRSPEFQRELWLSMKERDGLVCFSDVGRWVKNHRWITDPIGWPTGLQRDCPSPPPVTMATYYRHHQSPPPLEDQSAIKMGRGHNIIDKTATYASGNPIASKSAQSNPEDQDDIPDLGPPSQVISLRPVEVQEKYLWNRVTAPVTSAPVPSTPAPSTPFPEAAVPTTCTDWRTAHSSQVARTPTGAMRNISSYSSSSSSTSPQSVISVVPLLTPNTSPDPSPAIPHTQSTSASNGGDLPESHVCPPLNLTSPVTLKRRILFLDADHLAGVGNISDVGPPANLAEPAPPPEVTPSPPPPPPVSQQPQTQPPDNVEVYFQTVQRICTTLQREFEERQKQVQESLNTLNETISKSSFGYPEEPPVQADHYAWERSREERLNYNGGPSNQNGFYGAYYGPFQPVPPPPQPQSDSINSNGYLSSCSTSLIHRKNRIPKLVDILKNLAAEGFLSSNPWKCNARDPRIVDPANVDYKVKLLVNGMDKLVTEYGDGLLDQNHFTKLICKFRNVFSRIIAKILFPVNHGLAMKKVKMEMTVEEVEADEEEATRRDRRDEEEGSNWDEDIVDGFGGLNADPEDRLRSPVSPPPLNGEQRNAAIANVLPVRQPLFYSAVSPLPAPYPVPTLGEYSRRALNELAERPEDPISPIDWDLYHSF